MNAPLPLEEGNGLEAMSGSQMVDTGQEVEIPPAAAPTSARTLQRCEQIARGASMLAILIGLSVLTGWLLDFRPLMTVLPGFVAMKPNTAVAFCFAGLSLFLFLLSAEGQNRRWRKLSVALAGAVVTIGVLTVGEYATGIILGIDELLFRDLAISRVPGRMAPMSAANFVCLGLALIFLRQPKRAAWTHALPGWVAFTSLLAVVGYFFGVESLYQSGQATAVALHTAFGFLILSIGVWCASSHYGFMRLVTGSGVSGMLVRRYGLAAAFLPLLFGWLHMQEQSHGVFGEALGEPLFAMTNVLIFAGLVWLGASSLRATELREAVAHERLRQAHLQLERRVLQRTAELAEANADLQAQITSRQLAEVEVQRSQKRLRDLIDGLGPALFVGLLTPGGIVLECNRSALVVAGLHPEDVLGKPFVETYWWSYSPQVQQQLSETIARAAGGEASRYDVQIRVAENQFIDADLSLQPVYDGTGKVVFLVPSGTIITERKRAERAIERTLQRLNDAQRIARIGDWEWDFTTQAMTWSPQLFEIVGRDRGLGPPSYKDHLALYDAASRVILQESVAKAIESGEPQEYELVAPRPDGRRVHILAMSAPRKGEDGRVIGLFGTIQDITERRQADETRARLAAIVDSSSDAISGQTLAGVFTSWNAGAERLFGYRAEEVIGQPSTMIIPLDHRGESAEFLERLRREERIEHLETVRIAKDGRRIEVSLSISPVRDAAGRLIGLSKIAHDISARKQAEMALRASEAEFRTLTEAMPQIVWITRPDGWNIYFSQQWMDYTGLALEESLGPGWRKPFHPEDQQRAWDAWQQATATVGTYSLECRLRRADGVYRWWLIRGVPQTDAAGHILKWFGTCTDIHDLKLSEVEISRANGELAAAKDAAEAASRAKSEFLANMSHEIRTPMNGIIGMTQLVLETELSREQREYLGMAKSSAHSLLGLINDILDFSKIEAGKLELEAISFSLRDCVGTMLKPLGLRADQKGLELTAEIPAEVPDQLIGDPLRLRQILINLTDNAIKFTKQGDVMLRVSVESVHDHAHCLHFSVTDTGIGIPREKQALIFDAFAQADGTTTRIHGGTGLGLAIASRIVREMGGRIWVESTPGEGSAFHFTALLPVRATPAPSVRHADPHHLEGLRVLVVDDNAVNRRILREMLANWRMQPSVVASGATAIVEMLRAAHGGTPFPLVILDGMMPEMDGFMVAEKIREHAELSGATVMMLSSAMPTGAAARCAELGVASYLTKPVNQHELLDAILIAIGGAIETSSKAETPPVAREGDGLRILLAEDNAINRALAVGLLEKQGHSLTHAINGREAVEAAARDAYDLILMDVQMPEMDGFEAARQIRNQELASGHRTPIIALTAHAMAGDRERCLAAGMDDYLSKPVEKAELFALLDKIAARRSTGLGAAEIPGSRQDARVAHPHAQALPSLGVSTAASVESSAPIFSRDQLLDQLDGDEELLQQMIELFQGNTPRLLDDIRDAIAHCDVPAVGRAGHALLSSLGAFGANHAFQLTRRLETCAQNNDLASAAQIFAEIEAEAIRFYAAVDDLTYATAS